MLKAKFKNAWTDTKKFVTSEPVKEGAKLAGRTFVITGTVIITLAALGGVIISTEGK